MPALPTRPSLRHLKNEAKDLHKALVDGRSEAADRIREHLPSLAHGDKLPGEVTLQEVQHALAQEYGQKSWDDLLQSLQVQFVDLLKLSDQDVHVILTQVDQKDLVISLKQPVTGDEEAVREHLFKGMTPRVRTFLGQEMEYLGPMPAGEIEEVQQRIVNHVCQMGMAGRIAWPLGSAEGPNAPIPPPEWPPELDLVDRPLEELSAEEVKSICRGLCKRARASGILSLEEVADRAASPRVQEPARLAADGTEPDLIADILHTRRQALVHHLGTRMRMIVEAVMAMRSGDNPAIIRHKVNAVYSPPKPDYREPEGTREQFRERVAAQPVSQMDPDELTMLLSDAAEISRREGLAYLAQLAGFVDEELLATGLRMAAQHAEPDAIMDILEPRADQIVQAEDLRLRLLADGVTAIQAGVDLAGLEEVLDRTVAEIEAEKH